MKSIDFDKLENLISMDKPLSYIADTFDTDVETIVQIMAECTDLSLHDYSGGTNRSYGDDLIVKARHTYLQRLVI